MTAIPAPFTTTRELPPYTGILAVDAKGFTGEPGSTHQQVSDLIPRLAEEAAQRSGFGEAWTMPPFFAGTGDGFAIGVPTRLLPALVHPFLATLQEVLAEYNNGSRRGTPLIRLRVALHVGPVALDADRRHLGGNGTARNEAHRLLDSEPVRLMLAAGSAEVTYVAAVLSDRVFQDVVAAGFTGRHPDQFVEVAATVPGKQFSQRAWIYVPEPSGSPLVLPRLSPPATQDWSAAGARKGRDDERPDSGDRSGGDRRRPRGGTGGPYVGHNTGQVAGTVSGGMHQSHRGGEA
ncbi:hypothetical protein BDK92_4844 [Micromonospora pisi]|uniref:Guanylate cyclase domain-containing protein n=1 Tax=Micromonospora pisi TaxID=589240 RepID=A0A495JNQ7_9ACTN|nr:hypothetical protein [Micromonospora pisi]RKR90471.1 hypothetical protein BDK92_4844 [Micromonospora pisi]